MIALLMILATVGSVLAVVYVFVILERRNSSPARHAPMHARYEDATGMTYPDEHGHSRPLYDWNQEDVA